MENHVCYIDVKKGTITPIKLSKACEEDRVMLDCTDIFIKDIRPEGKLLLSDKEGIPLYCKNPEDVYTYFDRFIEMIDGSQREELCEWFYNSEYAEAAFESFT